MFSRFKTSREEQGPSAAILQTLHDAGYELSDENDLQIGLVAYSTALLVSDWGNSARRAGRPALTSHTGRNDPCPCGSGKKYKKCCLDKNRALPADGNRVGPLGFGSEMLPRLWDERAVSEDCAILGRIMDRDPALAKIRFSEGQVASFMDAVSKEYPSFFDSDHETFQQRIDDLGIRYARESGEGKLLEGIKDKFLAAAARTRSKDELRALATGICVTILGEASDDPDDNILNCIFFRRALAGAVQGASLIGRVMDQLGGDVEELRHLIATNDPAARDRIESCLKSLTSSEMDTIQADFDKSREQLWNTIASGEFPVSLPFATQLALFGRFASLTRNNEERSAEEMYEIIEAFSDELIEEDYVVYAQMLDRWLKNCQKRHGQVAKAVEMMVGLCAIRSIEDLAPSLFIRSGRQGLFVPFDPEERRFIEGSAELPDDPAFLEEYGEWLTSKGYPGMATRMLKSWDHQAGTEATDLPPARKASVG